MKAVIHETFGDPVEVLKTAEIDKPTPAAGQVLIRTILAPIHNHDLWTVHGSYGVKPALPTAGGTEAVGVIEALGEGVPQDLKGKRVTSAGAMGTWAEYFVAPAAGVIPLPDAIADEAAAQLVAMPFSAIALLEFLNVREGDWIVQTAANGAVGKILAKLAEARGVKILSLVRREAAIAELTDLGIDNVLSTEQDGWMQAAQDILGPNGARAAVDSVGGELGGDLVTLLGTEGLLVTFGTATGAPLQLDTGPIIFKHITLKGFWGKKVIEEMPADDCTRLMTELVTLAAQGKLPLTVDQTFSLDEGAGAARAARTPGRKGKVMFRA
ncbi:zinc-binding dehydrogenase [Mameliella sediminis]|uniref:zinc-binding dehydrogenase n=1 Tax=Mameliella sediminis TaxID=2836866 RepID=UPI001C4914AC|nr:zinc-binding dehydrogenase [Mameliella sediminis]MBV7396516.1 zinc-binding dehydrogenase [Mameliella sediminis]